jgi:hypothetical protein
MQKKQRGQSAGNQPKVIEVALKERGGKMGLEQPAVQDVS